MEFFANPYFDEILIFWKRELLTSQDKYKPYNCISCNKDLYLSSGKKNKADFVNGVQEALLKKSNVEWPFKENLQIQYSVTDIPSRIRLIDLDNMAKSLLDSLKGIVFMDDSQIVAIAGDKNVIGDLKAFIVAIKRLEKDEKQLFQNALFSSVDIYKLEREAKLANGKQIRFNVFE